jgi:hypothetical protein
LSEEYPEKKIQKHSANCKAPVEVPGVSHELGVLSQRSSRGRHFATSLDFKNKQTEF